MKLFKLTALALLLLVFYSCTDDSDQLNSKINDIQLQLDEATQENKLLTLRNILLTQQNNNVLLISVTTEGGSYILSYEDGSSLTVEESLIKEVTTLPEDWKSQFVFSDEIALSVDFLGDALEIDNDNIILNPSGNAPLSAQLDYHSKVEGKIHIKVHGQDGVNSDVVKQFDQFTKDHRTDILGLYPDYENQVTVTLTNKEGKVRKSETITIKTAALPGVNHPTLEIVSRSENVKYGMILFDFRTNSKPVMVDMFGKVRWILDITVGSVYGLQRLANGNICVPEATTSKIFEYDMMGRKIHQWTIPSEYKNIHHDLIELPSGNFVVTVDKIGASTIEDYLLELDRTSGAIVTVWNLNLILPKRTTFINDPIDWFHTNAVSYSASDNTLILSGQRMGIVKVTWDNKLKWILSQPEGWSDEFEPYLLKSADPNFESIWGQHAPLILPNGNLFLFDNGYGREYGLGGHFSRAVEFKISEGTLGGTVERVWEYGRDRGEEMFAPIISDVDYLPVSQTRLITAGSIGYELDYQNNTTMPASWSTDPVKARVIEVNELKEVIFEMAIKSNIATGSVYRSEKMSIYPE